jgi:hypothetical protein
MDHSLPLIITKEGSLVLTADTVEAERRNMYKRKGCKSRYFFDTGSGNIPESKIS